MQAQTWRHDTYSTHASFVSAFGVSVVDLLQVKPGERILDLGCGEGALAEQLRERGADVLAVDSSPSMILAARSRGIAAFELSGEALPFAREFDGVFSNAALHWMQNYEAVIRGVHDALKPGGRFVGEFGAEGNIKHIVNAMKSAVAANPDFGEFKNPWFFPTGDAYSLALQQGGFQVDYIETFPRPTPLATGIREWLRIFADHVVSGLAEDQAARFFDQVEESVRPYLFSPEHGWVADYVRLRFVATKPL
jgi:2-isopropylmalate synthase